MYESENRGACSRPTEFFFGFFFMYIGLLEMTQLTRKLPIALRLILRGFPGTDGLMSPLKDTKVNLLLNF